MKVEMGLLPKERTEYIPFLFTIYLRMYQIKEVVMLAYLVNQPRVVSRAFCDHSFGQAIWRAPPIP